MLEEASAAGLDTYLWSHELVLPAGFFEQFANDSAVEIEAILLDVERRIRLIGADSG